MSESESERKARVERQRAVSSNWKGPRSICTCGHTGDGPNSDHDGRFGSGHGACQVTGCDCQQFTWSNFLPAFSDALQGAPR